MNFNLNDKINKNPLLDGLEDQGYIYPIQAIVAASCR